LAEVEDAVPVLADLAAAADPLTVSPHGESRSWDSPFFFALPLLASLPENLTAKILPKT